MSNAPLYPRFDPAVRSVATIATNVYDAVALVFTFLPLEQYRGTRNHTKFMEELMRLDDRLITFAYDVRPTIGSGLEHLVDNFDHFKADLDAALRLLEEVDSRYIVTSDYSKVKEYMSEAREGLARLRLMVSQVNQRHLGLQAHFEFLLSYGGVHSLSDEAQEMLAASPALLRDEYFLKPRLGLISSYLKLVDEQLLRFTVSSDDPMTARIHSSWRRDFDRASQELEVIGMLELLDLPQEAVASSKSTV
jgi:hypothetical protein